MRNPGTSQSLQCKILTVYLLRNFGSSLVRRLTKLDVKGWRAGYGQVLGVAPQLVGAYILLPLELHCYCCSYQAPWERNWGWNCNRLPTSLAEYLQTSPPIRQAFEGHTSHIASLSAKYTIPYSWIKRRFKTCYDHIEKVFGIVPSLVLTFINLSGYASSKWACICDGW